MKDVHVVGKKMTRNAGKMAKLIGCAFRFETDFSYSIVSFVRPVLFNTLEYLSKKLKLSISDQLSEFPIHLEVYCGQKCKLWPFECA